jgi:hypothetical protein
MISCRRTCRLSPRLAWLLVALALAVLVLAACVREGGVVVSKQDSPGDWDKRAQELGLDDRRVLDQLVAFYTSSAWREGGQDFNIAIFNIDETAQLYVVVETLELPGAIAADELMDHIATQSMPDDPALYKRDQLARQTFPRVGEAPDGNKILHWSRAMVIGDYLRVAHFSFQMKPGTWNTPEAADQVARMEWIVASASFTPEVTAMDKIAVSTAMKQTSVDDVMRFRVPVGWARSRQKNWTLFDPGDPKLGVFEANWDLWTIKRPPADVSEYDFMHMHFTIWEKFPELLGAKDWAALEDTDHDKSPPERWITFRKMFSELNRTLVISFQYRVADSVADTPEIQTLIDTLEREIHATVVRFPPEKSRKKRAAKAKEGKP